MRKRLASGIELRNASSEEDYAAIVDLQRETWGDSFDDAVPPPMLKISQKMGGVVAGAFDEADRMLGFIYGMSGFRFGERAHWSHMLAVTRDARGLGLGRELKAFQREFLLELDVETVYWTYDPLVARNANLNLNRLGALPVEYVVDMYGEDTGSILHSGLGTDRFIVAWAIGSERVAGLMEGGPAAGPTRDTPPFPVDEALVNTAWVEVPPTIGSILRSAPEDASAWRRRTRAQFQEHLEDDYAVTGFTWRENPQPDAGGDAGAHTLLNRRYYYRLEKLEGTETQ
ncbi:MAG: hypothetical protein F4Y16_17015 [Holophagales bacterium]|nr:hypothetical protein [Holophagales bacterium]MYH26234.1 hypothetical protein [Holophagales bacterium]